VKPEPGSPSSSSASNPISVFSSPIAKDPLFLPSTVEDTPCAERIRGRSRSVVRSSKPPTAKGYAKQKAGKSGSSQRSPTPLSKCNTSQHRRDRSVSSISRRSLSVICNPVFPRTPLMEGPPPPNQLAQAEPIRCSMFSQDSDTPLHTWEQANADFARIRDNLPGPPPSTAFLARGTPSSQSLPTTPAVDVTGSRYHSPPIPMGRLPTLEIAGHPP